MCCRWRPVLAAAAGASPGPSLVPLLQRAFASLECRLPHPWPTCRGAQGPAGTIRLRARFMPFAADGALAERAAASGMGDPVLGSPPQTILTSQWRSLQVRVHACV